jgi:PASTA domain
MGIGGFRTHVAAVSGGRTGIRRTCLLACMVACAIALAPGSAASAATPHGTLSVSPITGSPNGYVVTVTNTGTIEMTGFEFVAGSPESPSQPKQLVPSSTCSYHGFIVCTASVHPGTSFQVCYTGAELSLFEVDLVARLKPEGEVFGSGAGSNFRASPVSACPLPGFTSSAGGAAGRCKVPKVVGIAQANAEKTLRKAGCKVGAIKKQSSSHIKKGDVVSQSVRAGKSVASGTKVGLVVSKGK